MIASDECLPLNSQMQDDSLWQWVVIIVISAAKPSLLFRG